MLAAARDAPDESPDRPLRVALDAHTVGRRQTGNERYVLELASALGTRDDVHLMAYVDRGADWPADYQPAPQLRELRLRAPQLRIPLELPYRVRRDRADLLQVTYVAPPVAGLPVVTVIHDVSFEDRPEFLPIATRLRLKWLVRLSARRSAAVVTISEFTRGRLIALYGLSPDRVHYVPVGVGRQWSPMSADDVHAAIAGLDLPSEFVLAVGRSDERKNLPRLVEAVGRLRGTRPNLELVICGPPGNGEARLARTLGDFGAANWTHRLGYIDDQTLRALYSSARVVAYPSLYEGLGLPVLEALACGATVVASSTTGVGEAAGDACLTVDPEDVDALASAIATAWDDESACAALRQRAQLHLASFDWNRAAERMVGVYRAALAPR